MPRSSDCSTSFLVAGFVGRLRAATFMMYISNCFLTLLHANVRTYRQLQLSMLHTPRVSMP